MSSILTRRDFLTAGSAVLAGLGFTVSDLRAIPNNARARRTRPADWLGDAPSGETFRALALTAMEAARAAGAEFADVRIGVQRSIGVPIFPYSPGASLTFGYGVRARVRGTWSFASGSILTSDAVASVARAATAAATRYAAINATLRGDPDGDPLAPAPVVTGMWTMPCEIDPFQVPLDDFYRTIDSLAGSSSRVLDSANVTCVGIGWQSELRVFASTEGALVTQRFIRGGPNGSAVAQLPAGGAASQLSNRGNRTCAYRRI